MRSYSVPLNERLVEVILRTNIILIDRGASLHINKLIVKGYSLQVLEYGLGHVRWGGIAHMCFATYYEYPKLSKFYKTSYNIVI